MAFSRLKGKKDKNVTVFKATLELSTRSILAVEGLSVPEVTSTGSDTISRGSRTNRIHTEKDGRGVLAGCRHTERTASPLCTGEARHQFRPLVVFLSSFQDINSEERFHSAGFSHGLKKHRNCLKSPDDK